MYRTSDACLSRWCGRRVVTIMLAVTLCGTTAWTAEKTGSGTLGLADALEAVASRSHAADVARLQVARVHERTRAVQSSELPTVNLTGGFVDRDSELVAIFGQFAAPLGDDTYWQYQANVRYLLWDGGVRHASIDAARAAEDVAARAGTVSVTRAQIEGLDAYLEAIGARARRRAIAQRIEAVKAHLAEVKDLFAQGMVARNDLLETEVRLRQVQDQDLAAVDAEAAAARTLARLMGKDPSERLVLPDAVEPAPPLRWSESELLEAALGHSPEIRLLKARLRAVERRSDVVRRDGMPRVFAQLSHTYEENPYLLYPNANVLFVGLDWNIFDGGARAAKRRSAGLESATVRSDLREAKRRVSNEIDAAYRAYRQALREARTAERNVAAATENLRIEEDQYKVGMVRTTDVLDAEALLAASRFELIARHEAAYARQGRLLALAGRDLAGFYRGTAGTGEGS